VRQQPANRVAERLGQTLATMSAEIEIHNWKMQIELFATRQAPLNLHFQFST